jgi:putative transcriptional regulator
MKKQVFDDLVRSVRDMSGHMRGERVKGVRERIIPDPEPRKVRAITKLSQREFAAVIGMPLRTVQNWEQKRTRPAGSARALLRAIEKDPDHVLQALKP